MQAGAGAAGQFQCGGDGDRFGGGRDAGQAEARGDSPSWATPSRARNLSCGCRNSGSRRWWRTAWAQQHLRIDDRAVAALREGNAAGAGEAAASSASASPFRPTVSAPTGSTRARPASAVRRTRRSTRPVRRAAGGRPAAGERGDAAGDGGGEFAFEAGQVRREIDEARADDAPGGIDAAGVGETFETCPVR